MRILLFILLSVSLCACSRKQAPAPYKHFGLFEGADSAGVHTVDTGDTLYNISKRYNLSMKAIIYDNVLHPPYLLQLGQRLNLPPPLSYKVKQGDTLYGVSRTFNVSITELAEINSLTSPYIIQFEQILRLPSSLGNVSFSKRHQEKLAIVRTSPTKPKVIARVPKRESEHFIWPVQGFIISSYGPKTNGLHNDGINIKANKGTFVRAADNGVVVYAGNELEGFGNLVLIRHANSWMSAYAHMDILKVEKGKTVKQGDYIGTVGTTGGVSTPQLHFEVRRGTKALNPEKYLVSKGIYSSR